MDVLSFDQEKLFKDICTDSIPFRLFTRLMLGIIFVVFFGDEILRGDEGLLAEEEGSLFRGCASQLCMELDDIKQILTVLLLCPGLQNQDIADVLNGIDVTACSVNVSFLERGCRFRGSP